MIAPADWYEERRTGTGARFLSDVARCLDLINAHPGVGTPIRDRRGREVRAMALRSFPYRIVYRSTGDILVVAIAHTSRRPGYWMRRL
jgi:toxin ParE1/3/4